MVGDTKNIKSWVRVFDSIDEEILRQARTSKDPEVIAALAAYVESLDDEDETEDGRRPS